jgi:hypothetical protein
LQIEGGICMTKLLTREIVESINKILNSYDKLYEFEKKGCSYEQIRKELLVLKNSTETLSALMPKLIKDDPLITEKVNLANIFRITYLPTLKIHLVYLSENQESKSNLLKIQARLAITYLNVDDCMNNLKILRTHLKT